MLSVTNKLRDRAVDFVVKGEAKDGVPPTESVLPGETKTLNVDPENAYVKAAELAGVITIERPRAAKAKE